MILAAEISPLGWDCGGYWWLTSWFIPRCGSIVCASVAHLLCELRSSTLIYLSVWQDGTFLLLLMAHHRVLHAFWALILDRCFSLDVLLIYAENPDFTQQTKLKREVWACYIWLKLTRTEQARSYLICRPYRIISRPAHAIAINHPKNVLHLADRTWTAGMTQSTKIEAACCK